MYFNHLTGVIQCDGGAYPVAVIIGWKPVDIILPALFTGFLVDFTYMAPPGVVVFRLVSLHYPSVVINGYRRVYSVTVFFRWGEMNFCAVIGNLPDAVIQP